MANPTLLKTPIASGGDKNTIPETTGSTTGLLSQEKGWQQINSLPINAGGIAPSRLDFNGVFNLLSNILFYTQKGWQWEFDETQNYFAGCTVKDTADGKTYVCIADVSASTTHPSADTTHWKLSDLATKSDLANYLPLAGGAMTGHITRATNDDGLQMYGGLYGESSFLQINGPNRSIAPGIFVICSKKSTSNTSLIGNTTGANEGTLTWGNNCAIIDNGLACFRGTSNAPAAIFGSNTGASLTAYDASTGGGNAGILMLTSSDGNDTAFIQLFPSGRLDLGQYDLGGSAIVAKSLGTTGYSKRADGLIEQWGQTTAPATVSSNVPVTFPITFPNAVGSVVITSEGNLTEGNSAMSYTQVIDVTASGFKYRSFSNSPSEIKKYWRAIGY